MRNKDWQNVFGRAPEQFLNQVDEALDRLKEEKNMKRRYKTSTVLIAAALIVLMTGAAVAASMGLIDRINQSGNYRVNEQAEQLITKDLGGMENELFTVVVEEALYDGQSAIMQILLTPKKPEQYALYHADYPMPDALNENFIFDAKEGQDSRLPTACRDGRTVLLYDVSVSQVRGDEMAWENQPDDLTAPQYNEDGSVRLLIGGTAEIPIRRDTIYFSVTCRWGIPGEYEYTGYQSEAAPYLPRFKDIRVSIENSDERTKFALEPAGEVKDGLLEFVGGTIEYTAVGGYYDIEYIYSGDEAWLNEFLWEADGAPLLETLMANLHGEESSGQDGVKTLRKRGLIERPEEIPETMTLVLTNRMYEGELGRIELKVVEE